MSRGEFPIVLLECVYCMCTPIVSVLEEDGSDMGQGRGMNSTCIPAAFQRPSYLNFGKVGRISDCIPGVFILYSYFIWKGEGGGIPSAFESRSYCVHI